MYGLMPFNIIPGWLRTNGKPLTYKGLMQGFEVRIEI